MENSILNQPFKETPPELKTEDDINAEFLNEHVKKFIEELSHGATPQEAARHSADFKNTSLNYRLEKVRHHNYWK